MIESAAKQRCTLVTESIKHRDENLKIIPIKIQIEEPRIGHLELSLLGQHSVAIVPISSSAALPI